MNRPDEPSMVTIDDIVAAASRIAGVAIRTPLLRIGPDAFIKPESLQPTGSFKIRGAYNALTQLTPDEAAAGVVTHSSGNHAQAVARAARLLGIAATVVMPGDAPEVKVAGVRADGAEIVFVGPANEERVALAHRLADERRLALVPSANDVRVIAGQGTCGLEIVEQLAMFDLHEPATVLVPIGLGGLAAGVATAVKARLPAAHVFGVEPEMAADTQASLRAGERIRWDPAATGRTMADGLRGEAPAPIPFAHLQRCLDGVLTVSEVEIAEAVRHALLNLRLVLEPSGAVTLAALLHRRAELPAGPIVVVASGGNIDRERLLTLLGD